MKTICSIQPIIFLSCCYVAFTGFSFGQKITSTSFPGSGREVRYTQLKGVIDNKEIRGNVTAAGVKYNYNLLVYENNKRLFKKDIEIKYNNKKYVPVDYFIQNNKIIAYFIAGSKSSDDAKLCLQEFNSNLEQIGDAIEIISLPHAIDPSKLMDNKSGGMFKDQDIKEQNLVAQYDQETGSVLFCYSLQLAKEKNISYSRIVLLTENFSILNTYDYEATSGENYIQVIPQQIFENNDATVSISEGIKQFDKNSLIETFQISKQVQIYIPSNGNSPKELELMPDQSEIVNIKTAENLSNEKHTSYAILSRIYDQTIKKTTASIVLYDYNTISEKLDRYSYEYDITDIFPNYRSSYYRIKKLYHLIDGSMLIWLTINGIPGQDHGNAFIKINSNKKIEWIKDFRRESTAPITLTQIAGYIDYFDTNGNFNLVFNFNPKKIKNNSLKTGFSRVDLASIPIIATVNVSTGETTIKKMEIENATLGGILITESEQLDNEGKYRMHMMINKKLQFVDIDFNAK